MALSTKPPPTPPRLTGEDREADQRAIQHWYSQFHNNLLNETRLGDPAYQYTAQEIDVDNPPDPTQSSIATAQATANAALARSVNTTPIYDAIDLKLAKAANLSDVANAATALANLGGASTTSPTITDAILAGVPLCATAAVDTTTNQLASTAFVIGQAASATPIMDGVAAVGTSKRYARGDHVHPTDTSRAPLASPNFTGTPQIGGVNITTDSGAWTDYTPTITPDSGTFTTTTITGRYKQVAKRVYFRIKFTITTLGSASTTAVNLSLPVAPAADAWVFIGRENAITGNLFVARTSSGSLRIQGQVSSPSSYPAGDGYVLEVNGVYEAS